MFSSSLEFAASVGISDTDNEDGYLSDLPSSPSFFPSVCSAPPLFPKKQSHCHICNRACLVLHDRWFGSRHHHQRLALWSRLPPGHRIFATARTLATVPNRCSRLLIWSSSNFGELIGPIR
jgi:hypothetical protein